MGKEAKTIRINGGSYSVRTKPNGVLEVRVWNPYTKKKESVYAKDTVALKTKLVEKLKLITDNKITTDDTVDEYITKWLYTYRLPTVKRSTFDTNEKNFKNYISPIIGSKKFIEVTDEDLQRILNVAAETKAHSTVKKIYEVIKLCWDFAYNRGDIIKNIVITVKTPKPERCGKPKKEIFVYTDEDILKMKRIIEECYNDSGYYRIAPIFIFLANTGLRIGECLCLKKEDFDFQNNTVKISKTLSRIRVLDEERMKNGEKWEYVISTPKTTTSYRIVDLNNTALWALQEIQRRNTLENIPDSEYMFSSEIGNRFNQRSIEDTLKRVCLRANLPYYGLHALRHTFASRCFNKGVPVEVVSKILGHSSPDITAKIYIHILPHQKRDAVLLLDA